MKVRRILRVDICDYERNIVCNLYDNKVLISGGAADVHIITERNGWKELTFIIPTYCTTEQGEEENFRLQFLKADYQIRTIDKDGTDYFLISEPKITHEKYSHNVSVRAGHISQLLKNRSLDLEFSAEEGNNVGTARNFLETILEGTGWEVGDVFSFKERDGKEKVRTLTASNKTGAFSLISQLCELFDAVPIYHGGTKKVDLVPINPFIKVIDGEIPQDVIDNNRNVVELHYGHAIKQLDKTVNTENMCTRLYAYGSSGSTYGIDIKKCFHNEYTFTLEEPIQDEYVFQDSEDAYYYFSPDGAIAEDTLVWSMLDLTSRTYIYNNRSKDIYRIYRKPHGTATAISAEPESVQNWFPYISSFNYYDEIGLLSDSMLKQIADFQRECPVLYKNAYDASLALSKLQTELSETANPGDGFARLDIVEVTTDTYTEDETEVTFSKIILHNTQDHPDAVLWRSDYNEKEDNYFQWHVAQKLKANGDPTSGIGSLIFVVRQDGTWDSAYVRCIYDAHGQIYRNSNGERKDYVYSAEDDYPSAIGLHALDFNVDANDHVYLFCTKSMTGSLGSAQAQDEAILENIQDKTTLITVKHPVIFEDITRQFLPTAPDSVKSGYGWLYRFNKDINDPGELYFCWGERGETMWHMVYYGDTAPSASNESYFYDTKKKTLHKRIDGVWQKYETFEEKEIASLFSFVIYACRKRDMCYHGLYEKYTYNTTDLIAGNYAFKSNYEFYWLFSTDQTVNGNLMLDTTNDHVHQDTDVSHIVSASVYPFDTITYPVANEFDDVYFELGSIDENGVEIESDTLYRTPLITLFEGETYEYNVPENSLAVFYDGKLEYIGSLPIGGNATFNPPTSTSSLSDTAVKYSKYVRIVVSSSGITHPDSETRKKITTLSNYIGKLAEVAEEFAEYDTDTYQGTATWTTYHNKVVLWQGRLEDIRNEVKSTKWNAKSNVFLRVSEYNVKLYANDKIYKLLSPVVPSGDISGINELTKKFDQLAIETYENQLEILNTSQKAITERDDALKSSLGDLVREGWWQDNNYAEDDEDRLYNDAMDNLEEISKPETNYSFTYIDLFESEPLISELNDVPDALWPDVSITDVAHLTDPEISVNVWGYIDKIDKCFDKPWETTIEINTHLSTISQHSFTDVMTRIANVAKEMKANQPIYARSKALNPDGTLLSDNLEGTIALHQNSLKAERSNWYTDDNNNLVFEAADGQSAMLLGGRGFGIANSKNKDGDWEFRQFGDGNGFVADELVSGYISADRIATRTITVDKLSSNVGHDLDISTNKTLSLYATTDGTRPAGTLKTSDAIIQIKAGDESNGIKAMINVASGGELNLSGGNINIESSGKLNLASSGEFHLRANGADNINTTANGVYIGTDGMNIGGGKLIFQHSGEGAGFFVKAQSIYFGDLTYKINNVEYKYPIESVLNGSALKIDSINGTMSLLASNTITIASGKTLSLVSSGGNVEIGNSGTPFIIGSNGTNAYIYNKGGKTKISDTTHDGIYIGTNGIIVGAADGNYVKATATGTVELTGKITANSGSIGGVNIHSSYGIYTGSKKTSTSEENGFLISKDGELYFGPYDSESESCPFQVDSDGVLTATSATIKGDITSGSTITGTTITGGSINIKSGKFKVDTSGNLTATSATITGTVKANSGYIASWTIGGEYNIATGSDNSDGSPVYQKRTDLFWSGNASTTRVVLDGSDESYPLSGLGRKGTSKAMYAFWTGAQDPFDAPFSVTKDGTVTIQKMRVKKASGDYVDVDMSNWTSSDDTGDQGDFDVNTAMGKLKFQTIKNVDVKTDGTVKISYTSDNGGTTVKSFNSAASVKITSASWGGDITEGGITYHQVDVSCASSAATTDTKRFLFWEKPDDHTIQMSCGTISFAASFKATKIYNQGKTDGERTLPSGVDRRSTDIKGTNLGTFTSGGKYIVFSVGSNNYYLTVES